MSQPSFISSRLDDVASRTPRGNEIIRREPREVPRRLRGLLLSIDGRQSVRTYIENLKGFGDVEAVMSELALLGLIEFRSGRKKRVAKSGLDLDLDSHFDDSLLSEFPSSEGTFGGISPAEQMLDDPAMLFEAFAQTTMPGSFNDLVRVAQIENKAYVPPPPPPPGKEMDIQSQVASLFALLEATRGERKVLKERVVQLRKYRDRAQTLAAENGRLQTGVYFLAATCTLLVIMLLMMALLRR
ncbi:MAG: hypothetical protein EOO54_25665 [Haliea sp.]|nr:MAG: hypothetical protein EOO54_25665 [Haliea sp.]